MLLGFSKEDGLWATKEGHTQRKEYAMRLLAAKNEARKQPGGTQGHPPTHLESQ